MQKTLLLSSHQKPNTFIREAVTSVGIGLNLQEKCEYESSKAYIKNGISKIKKVLIQENAKEKELLFEYYALFEKFLQSVSSDEEFDKLEEKKESVLDSYSAKDAINNCLSKKTGDDFEFLSMPFKLIQKLGDSIERGSFLTKNFFIRKEIWTQTNARIECLHQKHEVYKALYEKIDNLMILSKKSVINIENIDKFCDMLIDIQNNFSKEFSFIKPSSYQFNYDIGQSGFNRKFSDISNKIKNNLLSNKLHSKTDYIDTLQRMTAKTKDFEVIFSNPILKKREKYQQISSFFFHTIFKLIMQDVRDLSLRFLKKKYLSFESR